jgi:hypothetical protein
MKWITRRNELVGLKRGSSLTFFNTRGNRVAGFFRQDSEARGLEKLIEARLHGGGCAEAREGRVGGTRVTNSSLSDHVLCLGPKKVRRFAGSADFCAITVQSALIHNN